MNADPFRDTVFPGELEEVQRRVVGVQANGKPVERGRGLPSFKSFLPADKEHSDLFAGVVDELESNERAWAEDEHVLHTGLVGLSFSGGGIRSATFNLGVMQALYKYGLFGCIDYLSTVSGGGYIGSTVSSIFASLKNEEAGETEEEGFGARFPFRHRQGVPESAVFRRLRNNANYLAPKGLIDLLRIPALLLRGMVINIMVILPYLLIGAALTLWINPQIGDSSAHALDRVAFLRGLSALLGPDFLVTKLLGLLLLASFVLYPFARTYLARVGITSSRRRRERTAALLAYLVVATALVAFVELQPYAIRILHDLYGRGSSLLNEPRVAGLSAGVPVIVGAGGALLAQRLLPRLSRFGSRLIVYGLGLLGFATVWLVYLIFCAAGIYGSDFLHIQSPIDAIEAYLWVGSAVLLFTLLTVDANFTGIHKFYRDALSKAYIFGYARGTGGHVDPSMLVGQDELKLSELDTRHGPYHLLNALLNLQHPDESYRRGRRGDFFIFSKKYIGGSITGYCETEAMETASPAVDLATAMAISGAAAAPNMGKLTNLPLIFILGMLNVRLDYWLPNPRKVGHRWSTRLAGWLERRWEKASGTVARQPRAPWKRAGPLYLLRELLGIVNADQKNVNLSDGGHIENLGVYELLRRECRLIIVGDGERDPHYRFDGLAEVIRMAQIDFGIEVEVAGLDEIRRGEKQHAVGTIRYRKGRIGKLIYLKSSLLGDGTLASVLPEAQYTTSPYRDDSEDYDDNAYIAHYHAEHPEFPHESTGDQFFDERQFECYRALGYQVAARAISRRP